MFATLVYIAIYFSRVDDSLYMIHNVGLESLLLTTTKQTPFLLIN